MVSYRLLKEALPHVTLVLAGARPATLQVMLGAAAKGAASPVIGATDNNRGFACGRPRLC